MKLKKTQRGPDLIEYALILVLVAIVVIAIILLLEEPLANVWPVLRQGLQNLL